MKRIVTQHVKWPEPTSTLSTTLTQSCVGAKTPKGRKYIYDLLNVVCFVHRLKDKWAFWSFGNITGGAHHSVPEGSWRTNAHQRAFQEACQVYTLSQTPVAGDERGAHAARSIKPRHWWGEQQGLHTLRPISMVQRIKLPFTDKRHSAPLFVTLALQQVLAEWEMAPLHLNHCSTHLMSSSARKVAPGPRISMRNKKQLAKLYTKLYEKVTKTHFYDTWTLQSHFKFMFAKSCLLCRVEIQRSQSCHFVLKRRLLNFENNCFLPEEV